MGDAGVEQHAVDALIIACMTIFLTREQAAQPFCVACNRWKEEVELGRLASKAKHVAKTLESGRLSELPDLTFGTSHLSELSIHLCGQCQNSEDIVVQVKKITYNKGEEVKADAGRFQCDESAIVELSKLFEAGAEAAEQPLDEETEQLLSAANEVYVQTISRLSSGKRGTVRCAQVSQPRILARGEPMASRISFGFADRKGDLRSTVSARSGDLRRAS